MSARRYRRIMETLHRRQPDLTVVMEGVHKNHNLAAIARTCDAVGIGEIHGVSSEPNVYLGRKAASGTAKWVDLYQHESVKSVCAMLRERGFCIIAADVGLNVADYRSLDYTQPTAILVGSELDGLTSSAANEADERVNVPMLGMVESLNVSVATALILYEAMRQREVGGFYEKCSLDGEAIKARAFEWMHPEVADYCRRQGRAYPAIDDEGNIDEAVTNNARMTFSEFFNSK